jgi:hypothetical protein
VVTIHIVDALESKVFCHYNLRKSKLRGGSAFHPSGAETFEKCSILFQHKEDKKINRGNILKYFDD